MVRAICSPSRGPTSRTVTAGFWGTFCLLLLLLSSLWHPSNTVRIIHSRRQHAWFTNDHSVRAPWTGWPRRWLCRTLRGTPRMAFDDVLPTPHIERLINKPARARRSWSLKPATSFFSFLPGCHIEEIGRAGSGRLDIIARSRRKQTRCPKCSDASRAVHSRYHRHPANLRALGHEIRISLVARRFDCRNAHCPRRIFVEPMGLLLTSWARRTRRLAKAQGRIGGMLGAALEQSWSAFYPCRSVPIRFCTWCANYLCSDARRPMWSGSTIGLFARDAPTAPSWSIWSGTVSSTCCPTARPTRRAAKQNAVGVAARAAADRCPDTRPDFGQDA
jgi:hypothetical protein